jgi:ribosomal protein L18E
MKNLAKALREFAEHMKKSSENLKVVTNALKSDKSAEVKVDISTINPN